MQAYGESRGRKHQLELDPLFDNSFVRDAFVIQNSRFFRRMSNKTHVYSCPANCQVRTRLSHTLEVVSLATTLARKFQLNEDLVRAISSGHDIFHTPFGHAGEQELSKIAGKKVKHAILGTVLPEQIMNANLTIETLEGILYHSSGDGKKPLNVTTQKDIPQEYNLVRVTDKLRYLVSDTIDAISNGHLTLEQIPTAFRWEKTPDELEQKLAHAFIRESEEKGYVSFEDCEEAQTLWDYRKFLFENHYYKINEQIRVDILKSVVDYFATTPEFEDIDPVLLTILLTDTEVHDINDNFVEGKEKVDLSQTGKYGIFEIVPQLRGKEIKYWESDLSWTPYPDKFKVNPNPY